MQSVRHRSGGSFVACKVEGKHTLPYNSLSERPPVALPFSLPDFFLPLCELFKLGHNRVQESIITDLSSSHTCLLVFDDLRHDKLLELSARHDMAPEELGQDG